MSRKANHRFEMIISDPTHQDSKKSLIEESGVRVRYEWSETGFGS